MKLNLYSVKDTKLGRFNLPFYARDDQEASVILLRSGIPKSIYDDSELYRLGEFSDDLEEVSQILVAGEAVKIKLPPFPER